MIPAVEGVGVSWGPAEGEDVLSGISFSLPQGQVLAICGADGAGKTSLLRLICRQLPPRRGTVRLLGRDIWLMSAPQAAQCLAVVEQEQPGDFELTVRQCVALGRLPTGSPPSGCNDASHIDAVLARMKLAALADRPFRLLPGEDRQRTLIARALAQEPKVIVLDDPLDHLEGQERDLLRSLREPGLTVIVTLRDPALASGFADQVLVLPQGRLLDDRPFRDGSGRITGAGQRRQAPLHP
ncbi:ABC transporter ATP-binding protein [Tabrizicola sp.]|uniref:ABC transporter ATP-binding protein n=1 Tax=Tabrizicola sp. TaxID=2005166 RepID=UPI002FDD88DE